MKSPGFYPPRSPLCSTLPPVAWFSALPMPGPAPPEACSLLMGYRCCLSPMCLRETGSQAVSGTHTHPAPAGSQPVTRPPGSSRGQWPSPACGRTWRALVPPSPTSNPRPRQLLATPPLPPQSSHRPPQALCALRDPAAAPPQGPPLSAERLAWLSLAPERPKQVSASSLLCALQAR